MVSMSVFNIYHNVVYMQNCAKFLTLRRMQICKMFHIVIRGVANYSTKSRMQICQLLRTMSNANLENIVTCILGSFICRSAKNITHLLCISAKYTINVDSRSTKYSTPCCMQIWKNSVILDNVVFAHLQEIPHNGSSRFS